MEIRSLLLSSSRPGHNRLLRKKIILPHESLEGSAKNSLFAIRSFGLLGIELNFRFVDRRRQLRITGKTPSQSCANDLESQQLSFLPTDSPTDKWRRIRGEAAAGNQNGGCDSKERMWIKNFSSSSSLKVKEGNGLILCGAKAKVSGFSMELRLCSECTPYIELWEPTTDVNETSCSRIYRIGRSHSRLLFFRFAVRGLCCSFLFDCQSVGINGRKNAASYFRNSFFASSGFFPMNKTNSAVKFLLAAINFPLSAPTEYFLFAFLLPNCSCGVKSNSFAHVLRK